MNKPHISVIVPVYKVEEYLDRCVDSILGQTFKDFELILVDDASPDRSGAMCDEMAKNDKRVKVIHLTKNVGLSEARNQGLAAAQGEFISFVDSDDWIEGNFLEGLLGKAIETLSDIVACSVVKVRDENQSSLEHLFSSEDGYTIYRPEEALINIFTSSDEIGHVAWNKLYKRSLFGSDIQYPQGMLHEDVLTTYKLIARSNQVCLTRGTTYYYFQRDDSITQSAFNKKRLEVLDRIDEINLYLKNSDFNIDAAILYFRFSFTLFFVGLMMGDERFTKKRRALMKGLASMQPLSNNRYMSIKQRAVLSLLRFPTLYETIHRVRT